MAKGKNTNDVVVPAQEPQPSVTDTYQLPATVAEKYEVVGDQVHAYFPGFGEVDMRTLTIEAADALVKNGFPYLKAK